MEQQRSDEARFKDILMRHIDACVKNGSVELRGGFSQDTVFNGQLIKNYISDTRETFNNSVMMFRALLLPFFDETMEKEDKKFNEALEQAFKEYQENQKRESPHWKTIYYDSKVNAHRSLFEALIMLAKRKGFFDDLANKEA